MSSETMVAVAAWSVLTDTKLMTDPAATLKGLWNTVKADRWPSGLRAARSGFF